MEDGFVFRYEITAAKALIFLMDVDMAALWSPVAYCSDSREFGYALREALASSLEVAARGRSEGAPRASRAPRSAREASGRREIDEQR